MAIPTKTSILYRVGSNLEQENPVTGVIDGGVTTAYSGAMIPSGYRQNNLTTTNLSIGCGVTEIRQFAFDGCSNLSGQFELPETLTTLGASCFDSCSSLSGSLSIPNGVTTIGDAAFKDCTGFNGQLIIGSSVATIGSQAFLNCGFIGNLVIPNSVTSIGTEAFADCANITGLTLSQSITVIPAQAFRGCLVMTGDIIIPNSVTAIQEQAFQGILSGLGAVTIGTSVVHIDDYAFEFTNIASIVIPDSVQTIGVRSFSNCIIGGLVSFGTSLTTSQLVTIGTEAFLDSTFTGSILIPNSVVTISDFAFSGNTSANGIIRIGTSVNSIGDNAFAYTSGITRVESWATAAPAVGTTPFLGCGTSEIHVKFSATGYGSTYVGMNVIYDLDIADPKILVTQSGLKKGYNFPTGVVPMNFRKGNTSVTSVDIGDGITAIQIDAFEGCTNLTSVTFGNSLQTISRGFAGTALAQNNLVLPNSLYSFGYYSFANITGGVGEVTLPTNPLLTSIGSFAFYNSDFVGDLVIPDSVTVISISAFRGCGFNGTLTLSNQINEISNTAFYGTPFTGTLVIPASIQKLRNSCFAYTSFTEIHFLGLTPPTIIEANVFLGTGYPDMHVPAGTASLYAAAFPDFLTIIDDL